MKSSAKGSAESFSIVPIPDYRQGYSEGCDQES